MCSAISFGQTVAFNEMIDDTLEKSIPFITSEKLLTNYNTYIILDTRALDEYDVSRLENAIHVGYDDFNMNTTSEKLSLKTPIVVYCSIGYRSEKIGEKLVKNGYKVYNLYGGIFDWINNGNTVVDSLNNSTNKVHCYNSDWSKWLTNGEKIYD